MSGPFLVVLKTTPKNGEPKRKVHYKMTKLQSDEMTTLEQERTHPNISSQLRTFASGMGSSSGMGSWMGSSSCEVICIIGTER
jgi:hypothetical protein